MNKQPWRIVVSGNDYHFYEKHDKGYVNEKVGDMQKIDIGIALCHFMSGLEAQGKKPEIVTADPGIAIPEGVEYIVTVKDC